MNPKDKILDNFRIHYDDVVNDLAQKCRGTHIWTVDIITEIKRVIQKHIVAI